MHGQPVILVAGLGNQSVTPDSLGPRTVNNLSVSQNETGLKAIAPGVMAQTGMETARILSGLIREIKTGSGHCHRCSGGKKHPASGNYHTAD